VASTAELEEELYDIARRQLQPADLASPYAEREKGDGLVL
jgi:hypothetical protein